MQSLLAASTEHSANRAARVGHYTRTISTSTQNTSIWSLTAAAPSDSVFRALCINVLTYLLTYLYLKLQAKLQHTANTVLQPALHLQTCFVGRCGQEMWTGMQIAGTIHSTRVTMQYYTVFGKRRFNSRPT